MSLSDSIADMLTRVRNAQSVGYASVSMPYSNIKGGIARVLQEEGYIESFVVDDESVKCRSLEIFLKYYAGAPVIAKITRISRPGLRMYSKSSDLLPVMNGLGIAILSTSKGVMTDKSARRMNIGGEVLCTVA